MKYLIMASCLIILMAASCKKNKATPKTELEKLPPITQTGANTFGCLLNGKAWIPKDNYGQASFTLQADPTFENGSFGVSAVKYDGNGNGVFFGFSFGSTSCTSSGTFDFSQPNVGFSISDIKLLCSYDYNSPNVYKVGSFTITRYDLANRVFSGTFDFTIYQEGCGDTLRFTNGRFDKKL